MANSVTDPLRMSVGGDIPMTFKTWFLNDRDHSADWREEAKEDYDFVAGRQYSDAEIAALKKGLRPVVVFNRVGTVVDSIHGHEIGNRREVRYIPREMGDVKPNELLTSAAEWFRDLAHADDQESDSFLDSIICGMGWTESRLDFEDKPEGEPSIKRIDPLEMFWDFDAKARNLADARRVWRARRIPYAEAVAMFPDKSRRELDATWTTVSSVADLKRDSSAGEGDDESGDVMVTIVHVQWIERETYYIAYDPMSQTQAEFSQEEFQAANKRMKQLLGTEMQGARMKRRVRKQAFLGDVVLAYGDAPCADEFSFQCITAKRDRNKGTWYGIVRAMKDPQRWANKWLSQTMHIMNSNSKGGLLAEKNAFENVVEAEERWSDPSAIVWMKDGALSGNKVTERTPTQFPVGFQQLTEYAVSSIRDVTGVSVEMLGMREADQAASLEYQRRQAGMTILQPLFDSLKHYRERQGRVMLYYIQNDLSDGRLVRIAGDGQERYVPLMKQAASEFDIIVDDAPNSPNQKEQVWGFIQMLLPVIGKMVPPQMILKLMEYSPLPSSIVEDLTKMAEQMGQDPHAKAMASLEVEGAKAEVAETVSKARLNQAKAAETGQDADPTVQANMEWRKALLDALTKIEVAQIKAGVDDNSNAVNAEIEERLGWAGLASDQIKNMRQLAHQRAIAQMQPKEPARQ